MMMRTPLEERFWAKVKKTRTCWLWTGTFPTFKEAQTVYRDAAKLAHGAFYC